MKPIVKVSSLIPVVFTIAMTVEGISNPPAGEDAASILNRMDKVLEDVKSIRGRFSQEVDMTLMGETKSFGGRVYYRHPDFLRLEYDEPPGQLLVCDGESFWMVMTDQDRPQVFKTPFTGEIGGFLSHSTLRFLIEKYEARVAGEADIRGALCYKICFNSREDTPAVPVQDLCLWVGKRDFISRRLSYEDLAGNRIIYQFYEWSKVDSLPDRLFSYTPSPEADLFENVFNP